jgi:hypothetical protein
LNDDPCRERLLHLCEDRMTHAASQLDAHTKLKCPSFPHRSSDFGICGDDCGECLGRFYAASASPAPHRTALFKTTASHPSTTLTTWGTSVWCITLNLTPAASHAAALAAPTGRFNKRDSIASNLLDGDETLFAVSNRWDCEHHR